jgi:aspartate racemase
MSNADISSQLTIGVLGGMGPQATVDFLNEVIALTPAEGDQDHLRVLIDSNPKVPDRQAAMQGDDSDVQAALRDMALGLERQGADFLVMPCNTAHAFLRETRAAIGIPFISIIDVTVEALREAALGAKRVGLLATDACIESGNYQGAAGASGLEVTVPDLQGQTECMALIAAVKAGDTGPAIRNRMAALAGTVVEGGVDALIAGCTEIPLVLDQSDVSVPLLSSTDILARRAVDLALGRRTLD